MCTSNPSDIAPPPPMLRSPVWHATASKTSGKWWQSAKQNEKEKTSWPRGSGFTFQQLVKRFNLPTPGGAWPDCSKANLPGGGASRAGPGVPRQWLMICLLVKQHLEKGESGPALAVLSINQSAASTSQPSILDSEDSNYFNCATRRKNMFVVLLFQLKRQSQISIWGVKTLTNIFIFLQSKQDIVNRKHIYDTYHLYSLCQTGVCAVFLF